MTKKIILRVEFQDLKDLRDFEFLNQEPSSNNSSLPRPDRLSPEETEAVANVEQCVKQLLKLDKSTGRPRSATCALDDWVLYTEGSELRAKLNSLPAAMNAQSKTKRFKGRRSPRSLKNQYLKLSNGSINRAIWEIALLNQAINDLKGAT